MLMSFLLALCFVRDTCIFHPVDRELLPPKKGVFAAQYESFRKDRESDYQLLYFSGSSLIYVNITGDEVMIRRQGPKVNTLETVSLSEIPDLLQLFKDIVPGEYLGACDNKVERVEHCLLVKVKWRIVFSFDGYNRDFKDVVRAHDELASGAALLKAVE
jgi:hypothetical protein